MAQRLINSDLAMQWTRSMAQRGWYLHLRLGGISAVFARYSLVFASGGGFSMMSIHVTSNGELTKKTTEHCTRRQRHRMHEHVSHHPKRYLPLPVTLNIILIRAEGHTTGKVRGVGPSRILAWALFSVKIRSYRLMALLRMLSVMTADE